MISTKKDRLNRHFMPSLFVVFFAISLQTFAEPKNAKVFILAGQSNMVGVGMPCELSTTDIKNNGVFNSIIMYSANANQTVLNGPETLKAPLSGWMYFGPEIGIGEVLSYYYAGETIYFVKVAWGGTDLYDEWLGNTKKKKYENNVFVGYESYTLYEWFLGHVNNALYQIQQQNGAYKICGMFWMQGESDAGDKPTANAYKDNLLKFIDRVRIDLRTPHMPFIFGKIQNYNNRWNEGEIVQAQQELAGNEASCAMCVKESADQYATIYTGSPNIHCDNIPGWINCTPEYGCNTAHYNTAGIVYIGRKFGSAMIHAFEGRLRGCGSTLPIEVQLLR